MPTDSANSLSKEVEAGQAVYSPRVLKLYDLFVLGLSNRLIWRCPSHHLLNLYNEHVTPNHLDVGVGTGYFLDHCRFPAPNPRLVLVDLNRNCLDATARRVGRYSPVTLQRNILQPFAVDGDKFDSIGLNYVMHCLPGTLPSKAIVFDHLQALLNPGGTLFGSTLLSTGVPRGYAARRLMSLYNRQGIFSNRSDSLQDLQQALSTRFTTWHVEPIGCAALFFGKR